MTDGAPAHLLAAACRGVSKTYQRAASSVPALVDIDLSVPTGEITALFGPSGSGKSTLLRLLAGVDRPDRGEVLIGAVSIGALSTRQRRHLRLSTISYVFPEPAHNLVGYLNARDQLVLAARLRGAPPDEAEALLRTVGLGHRTRHLPHELSGGEQQRLAVAAAVIGSPSLILCDEPTAELDHASAARLLATIQELGGRGTTFVIASHDPEVRAVASGVLDLDHGRATAS
jgi:putative ABC transport system ATP-binding protein